MGFPPSLKLGFPLPFSSGRIDLIRTHAIIVRNDIRKCGAILSKQGYEGQ
jgi:hypothetical protein